MYKKIFTSNFPLFLAVGIFLFFQLQYFNLGLNFSDEGQHNHFAQRILAGQIPYRDFYLLISPGTYYLLAFAQWILGEKVIVGRILYIIVQISIIFLLDRVYRTSGYFRYLYLLTVALLFIKPAGFSYYTFEAIATVLCMMLCIRHAESSEKKFLFFFAGFFGGLSFIFKQSFGIFVIPSTAILLAYGSKDHLKSGAKYLIGTGVVLGGYILYLTYNSALLKMIGNTFVDAGQLKNYSSEFVIHRLIFIPIFIAMLWGYSRWKHQRLKIIGVAFIGVIFYFLVVPARFGRLITYISDPVFWFYSISIVIPILYIHVHGYKKDFKTFISILSVVVFFSIVLSGYSVAYAQNAIPLILPTVYFLGEEYSLFLKYRAIKPVLYIGFCALTLFFLIGFNPFSGKQNIYGVSSWRMSELTMIPQLDGIQLSREEQQELEKVRKYVMTYVKHDESIFCYPMCPMMYVLTERKNSSYYNWFYFDTFLKADQIVVTQELKSSKPKIIILQKIGFISPSLTNTYEVFPELSHYLKTSYKKVYETDNFIFLTTQK